MIELLEWVRAHPIFSIIALGLFYLFVLEPILVAAQNILRKP